MQNRLGEMFSLKHFFMPRKNHWLKRTALVYAFIMFDYLSTLLFCHTPNQEANVYVRVFMENFGIPLGLTLFVLVANLPIYVTLTLDSHIVRLPYRVTVIVEAFLDSIFAWFVAGMHFSGGASWFWSTPELTRQIFGASLYLFMAFLLVKPRKPSYNN